MIDLKFLSALPAVLGIGGYVAYLTLRSRATLSPILSAIVEIVRQKGGALPTLDTRLSAKQVCALVACTPDLQGAINKHDYDLLEATMRREERSNILAVLTMLICLAPSSGRFHRDFPRRTRSLGRANSDLNIAAHTRV